MYSVKRQDPLATSLDSLLGEIFRPALVRDGHRSEALPLRVDVRETAEAYVVNAELPGVKKEQIEIEVEGNEVSIAAEIGAKREPREGEKWLRVERFHGKTARRFALPLEIDETRADAKFADGVLELTLPKKAPAAGRRIAIQ
jgi:HSP20 family protein